MTRFKDRTEAGRLLARKLEAYRHRDDVPVLALPRGGVPVAFEVARHLGAPMDVFVVRKLGVPGHEELAMGALASGGARVLNDEVIEALRIPRAAIEEAARRESSELERRERLYRGESPQTEVQGRVVILVDDGLATGSTMRAAVAALKSRSPARIVLAVPVAAPEICARLRQEVDEAVCLLEPQFFNAVGAWYEDFSQTSDDEVRRLLAAAGSAHAEVQRS